MLRGDGIRNNTHAILLRTGFIAALLALTALAAPEAEAQTLEAPYQLNEMLTDFGGGSLRGGGPVAHLVDLDNMPGGADRQRWAEATVLTEYGPYRATLLGFRKSCDLLCGEEAEACRYQAVLDLDDRADGDLLYAAFPGSVEVSDLHHLPAHPISSPPAWSAGFHKPLWPEENRTLIRIDEWDPWTRRLSYTVQSNGSEQRIEEPGCRASGVEGFVSVQCHRVAILAADGVPLLVSHRRHADAIARPVLQFTYSGELNVMVQLGVETQAIYGMLVHRGEGWIPRFRRVGHPPHC